MATIQFRRGSKSVLDAYGVTPSIGEPIWEKDTNRLKIGDGVHLYVDLPYFGPDEFHLNVDNKSIELDSNDCIALFGFEGASDNLFPVKVDGHIEWHEAVDKDSFDALSDQVSNLDTEVSNLDHDVNALEDEVREIQVRIDGLDPERIDEALQTVERYEDRLDAAEALLGQHEERLNNLELGQEQITNILNGEDGEPGLVDRVENLDEQVNSEGGLVDRIEALEQGSGIDMDKIYTTDDIMIIDGGTEKTVIIEDHRPVEIWED